MLPTPTGSAPYSILKSFKVEIYLLNALRQIPQRYHQHHRIHRRWFKPQPQVKLSRFIRQSIDLHPVSAPVRRPGTITGIGFEHIAPKAARCSIHHHRAGHQRIVSHYPRIAGTANKCTGCSSNLIFHHPLFQPVIH